MTLPTAPAAKEYKVIVLRECPLPESLAFCDTPERALNAGGSMCRPTPIPTRNANVSSSSC